jgi:hypothetical protein
MMEITGTLKHASRERSDLRGDHIHGMIVGDVRGRFQDGDWVSTSTIMEGLPDNVFRTRYSVYKVEFEEVS